MSREKLKDAQGQYLCVDEGEVARVTATFADYDGTSLASASISAITVSLRNEDDLSVINGRSDQSVLNANGGILADVDGVATLTLVLDESDNVNAGGLLSGKEVHLLDLQWQWNDGTAFRTGKSFYEFDLCVIDTTTCDIPWIG
jgi:hypothetical protein